MGGYVKEISSIFSLNHNRHLAHQLSLPVLKHMAGDKQFLFDLIRNNFSNSVFLNAPRDYSKLLKLHIAVNSDHTLVMNIFPPNPFGNETLTVKSIHHHNNLLLSTVTAIGPGYETIIFNKRFEVSKEKEVKLSVERNFVQARGEYSFIDARTPHVVFFPSELTATYSLWSMNKPRSIDKLKAVPNISNVAGPIIKTLHKTGLGKRIGLNDVSEVYYFISNGKIRIVDGKINYQKGNVKASIRNLLCFIHKVGFTDHDFLNSLVEKEIANPEVSEEIKLFISDPEKYNGFVDAHEFIPEENYRKEDLLAALQTN